MSPRQKKYTNWDAQLLNAIRYTDMTSLSCVDVTMHAVLSMSYLNDSVEHGRVQGRGDGVTAPRLTEPVFLSNKIQTEKNTKRDLPE